MINLNHALFQVDPDERFSKQFAVPIGTWMGGRKSIWYRYKWLYYDIPELQEYIELKYGVTIHRNTLMRWFNRTEVYLLAERWRNRGAQEVNPIEFNGYVDFVISELKLK